MCLTHHHEPTAGGLKIGDRVGVGAQVSSCLQPDCYECMHDNENYCQHQYTIQYNSRFKDGSKAFGGFADYSRAPSHFVFKIPDNLPSSAAAPMLCGGVTAFSPMLRHGAGPGKAVGVVGIGGIGHYGILSAKVLGAEKIVAISRNSAKKEDCVRMGATDFIATDEEEDWAGKHHNSLDLIVSTVASPNMPLRQYLQMLKVGGVFCVVGAEDNLPTLNAFDLLPKRLTVVGSGIGSPKEIRQMLDLFAEKGVHSWTNDVPMKDANQALRDMDAGRARYRLVLVNEKHTKGT